MPLLLVLAAAVGVWALLIRRKDGERGARAEKAKLWAERLKKAAVAVIGVVLLAAMAHGCDDGTGQEREPCVAFHAEDCPPVGGAPATTTTAPAEDTADVPRLPCSAYRIEDCPPAPDSATTAPPIGGGDGPQRQMCTAYREEDCPLAVG